jgi:hypothetical protein
MVGVTPTREEMESIGINSKFQQYYKMFIIINWINIFVILP